MYTVIWISALTLAGTAGWLDWRSRRIPNWLTVPALIAGVGMNVIAGGLGGARTALEGAGLALGLLLPFVLLRGLGAGDWKLMGALGAFLGPQKIIVVLLATIFVAGLMGIIQMVRKQRVKETLSNLYTLIKGLVTFGILPFRQEISLDNPQLMKVPFGVAAALATGLFLCAQPAFRIFFKG